MSQPTATQKPTKRAAATRRSSTALTAKERAAMRNSSRSAKQRPVARTGESEADERQITGR